MSFSTPIGFLIFNRPDLTDQVFSVIAQVKPQKLFVIADGPRFSEEAEKCAKTRAIIQKVDWDCDILTDFSDTNLGCGKREATGFDWVFSQVEEAIFLEDDTIPTLSFFTFCQNLLEHYRDDERIMHISGSNLVNQQYSQYSYYFSKYINGWGWASWRRAWQHYDYSMKSWPQFKSEGLLEFICKNPFERKYWTKRFEQMYADPQVFDTWDYQWLYTCWAQNGLTITPNENLISNLGFNRLDSAHTRRDSPLARLKTKDISEIYHPPFMMRNQSLDDRTFDKIYGSLQNLILDQIPIGFRQDLSSLIQTLKKS
jgi:hypothetical protein